MNTLIEQIKKGQESFDNNMAAAFLIADERVVQSVLDRMKQWHTSFLISLLEGERWRLKNQYKIGIDGVDPELEKIINLRQKNYVNAESFGYNKALKDQISHIDEALAYLKTNV